MEITYKIVATDGQQYGPVTLEQLRGWISEGRLGADTQIWRSDTDTWLPAAQFPELGLDAAVPPGVPQSAVPVPVLRPAHLTPPPGRPTGPLIVPSLATPTPPGLEKRLHSGAGWFFWIAGLSLVNSLIALGGSDRRFIVGLGITQIFDAVGQEIGGGGKAAVLVLDVIVAGIFVMFGIFARKRHTWSFITGMVLYGLDGLICLLIGEWLPFGFHALALFYIFSGMRANLQLKGLAAGQA